jgi:hypothetical protein
VPVPEQVVDGSVLIERVERRAPGAVELALHLCMAVRIERSLVRRMRLHVLDHLGAVDEADLWASELVEVRGLDGLLVRADVTRALQARARNTILAGAPGAATLRSAWDHVVRHHAGAPPLVRLEERIAWTAISDATPEEAIAKELDVALAALVRERRVGVARWADRALRRLPERALRTESAWLLDQAANSFLYGDTQRVPVGPASGGARLDTLAAIAPSLPDVALGVRRIGDRLELGAVEEGGVGIRVPGTEPRLVRVHPGEGEPINVAVAAGTREVIDVGWGAAVLQSANGAQWEVLAVTDEEQRALDSRTVFIDSGGNDVDPATVIDEHTVYFAGFAAGFGRRGARQMVLQPMGGGAPLDTRLTPLGADGELLYSRSPIPLTDVAPLGALPRLGAKVVTVGIDGAAKRQGPPRWVPLVGTVTEERDDEIVVLARCAVPTTSPVGAPVVVGAKLVGIVRMGLASDEAGTENLYVVPVPEVPIAEPAQEASRQAGPLTVELLPASWGTAVLLTWGRFGDRHSLLADTGPRATARRIVDRVRGQTNNHVELVLASHPDSDRIGGLVPLLTSGLEVGDVWFNGSRQLGVWSSGSGGIGELESRLAEGGWNRAWGGGPIVVPATGSLPSQPLPGGARVTVLGPDDRQLRELAQDWVERAERSGIPPPPSSSDRPRSLGAREFTETEEFEDEPDARSAPGRSGGDRSRANGASVAVLFEFEGHSVLLPGDAHPGPLLDSIQRVLADRGADRLHLDVFVLPHGGSANNVLPELFEAVDAATYAICTDGSRYGFPRQETIEMLARVMQRPITVAFNYRSQTTAKFDDGYVRKELQLQPIYPEGSEGGLVLSLEAADRLAP